MIDDNDNEAEFELIRGDEYLAGASGPRAQAWSDIQHYALVYGQDGPVEIYEVTRTVVLDILEGPLS